MFIFRGLGRLVLDNQTVAIQDSTFLNIFTAYINIPGLDDGDTVLSALIVGVVAAVYVILNTVKNRRERAKKGYRQNSAAADYLKAGIIAALILAYCYMLSQYRGISVMLVWVVAICLIYNFITAKTAFGRYFYAVGGNEKATQLSGINTNKIYFIAYANMGLLAGLCGLLNAARVGSVNGNTGTSFEMDLLHRRRVRLRRQRHHRRRGHRRSAAGRHQHGHRRLLAVCGQGRRAAPGRHLRRGHQPQVRQGLIPVSENRSGG